MKNIDIIAPNFFSEFVFNMAPNEGRHLKAPGRGIPYISTHHDWDSLSSNGMDGAYADFSSEESIGGRTGGHTITSFILDIKGFVKAWGKSKDKTKFVDNFVGTMRSYGVNVTVQN